MTRRAIVVAATAAGALACGLVLQWAPSPGAPGGGAAPASSDEFQVAGDGDLPEKRPALRGSGAPLSSDERGYGITLALAALPGSARDVLGHPGAEVLLADLPAQSQREGRRRIQISAYDYHDDRLHQFLIDLGSGDVIDERTTDGAQLPPSAAETRVAVELAIAAQPTLAFVKQYAELTGAPLSTGDQVQVVGLAWAPGGARDRTGEAARPDDADPDHRHDNGEQPDSNDCGHDRCVQLLVALPSGQYLNTQDFLINLSHRTVTVVPAGPSAGSHNHG